MPWGVWLPIGNMLIFRTLQYFVHVCVSEHSVKDDDGPSSMYAQVYKNIYNATAGRGICMIWCSLKVKWIRLLLNIIQIF